MIEFLAGIYKIPGLDYLVSKQRKQKATLDVFSLDTRQEKNAKTCLCLKEALGVSMVVLTCREEHPLAKASCGWNKKCPP